MENLLITVAIPFYNAEKYLSLAIDSVLKQTFRNWKLILVDDGSTDASLEIAKKYEKTDPRIRVYSDGENRNLGFRLNQIPDLVDTEFLARMDADDIMHPERLEKQLATFREMPGIDVLGTNAFSIDENNDVVGIRINPEGKGVLIKVSGFIHPTVMARTDWFRKNPYDVMAVRIEDAELWMRTRDSSEFYCLTEPLLYYREIGDHYYKKYFKAFPSLLYILKTPTGAKLKFVISYILASLRSYTYFFVGKEDKMILKRNQIQLKYDKNIYRSTL